MGRKDGTLVRDEVPMYYLIPHFLTERHDSMNMITLDIPIEPQRAYMNVGTEESPKMIYVENSSKTTWEAGTYYRLYADAYGMYDSVPWLIARYTYLD